MVRSLRVGHRRFVLHAGVNSIGRDPGCVVLLNDPSVSREHARIIIDRDQALIEDLKSKNGTSVMGEPINGPTMLRDGDEIEFGHVRGWFIVESAEEPPTTTHL